jgi:putative endonuclease
MSGRNQKIGTWGESVAAEYLKERGYIIVARNVRTPYGEIDIIAEKDGFTIFVEVKTRTSKNLGPPEISVTPRKQEHMLAAAEHFSQENEIDHWQIDVVAVEGKPSTKPKFTHFENALG